MNVITSVTTQSAQIRAVLTAARTYYVRTDGSNSNDGLTNNAAGASLTIQYAIDVVCNSLDIGAQSVVIQVADGAYNAPLTLKSYLGSGSVTLRGNTSTPANVSISTSSTCIGTLHQAPPWRIEGFKLSATGGSYDGLYCLASTLSFAAIEFGACGKNHITCEKGGRVSNHGNYSISGGAETHITSQVSSWTFISGTVTLTSSPAFSWAFVQGIYAATAAFQSATFTGTATGTRYRALTNGIVTTYGGGANYLPGSVAGVTSTGGQYE